MTALPALPSAPAIRLEGLTKHYAGGQPVLDGLDLEFGAGQFNVILGASGCGKSTLLRLVAGLESPDRGRFYLDAREVTPLPPRERQCAMVFQNYALYPHLSVADNLGYCLKLAGLPRDARQARIHEVANSLGIEALLPRLPGQLSGGQRQRVAIGRALVRRPPVLLFDEPLCNLDSGLRQEMRLELRRLQRQTGATILYVTHDQTEAMTLADQILLLDQGRLQQRGTPQEIYHQPASTFVAGFFGTPPMNLLEVRHEAASGQLLLADGQRWPLPQPVAGPLPARLLLGIRPEDVRLGGQGLVARLDSIEDLGSQRLLHLRLGEQRLTVAHLGEAPDAPDCHLHFPAAAVSLFTVDSGRRLGGP